MEPTTTATARSPASLSARLKVLLVILLVAVMAFRFTGQYRTSKLPRDLPLVGEVELQSEQGRPAEFVMVPICNREMFPFNGTVYALGSMHELDTHGMITRPADSEMKGARIIQEVTADSGTYVFLPLCMVKKERQQPVHLRLKWRCGFKTGDKDFTIAPSHTEKPRQQQLHQHQHQPLHKVKKS